MEGPLDAQEVDIIWIWRQDIGSITWIIRSSQLCPVVSIEIVQVRSIHPNNSWSQPTRVYLWGLRPCGPASRAIKDMERTLSNAPGQIYLRHCSGIFSIEIKLS